MATKTPARARLLETATRLFYAAGVHAVGIDRIIAEAGVAKATFYSHFPSKDDLVRAYVEQQSELQRAAATRTIGTRTGDAVAGIVAYFEYLGEAGASPSYRGCPVVNVAVEYPDPDHAVRRAVTEHRRWFREWFRDLLTAAGHPAADRTADILVLLRDGLLIGLDLDDPSAVRAVTADAVNRALSAQAHTAPTPRRRRRLS